MKISILQQDLLPALQAVSRSVGVKVALPVLANVLLQCQKGKLTLSATNLEIGVIKQVNCKVQEEGEVTVPARTFLEIISALPAEEITLESNEAQLKVSTKSFNATLNGISATEFPAIPTSSENSILIPSQPLQHALEEITFAAAVDEGRPILTGILTQVKNNILELVATDGFRLAHKSVSIKTDGKSSLSCLIPRRTFEEVVRIISEDLKDEAEEKVEISTSENQNQMVFKLGQTIISSRLIEGQFPAWEKIIPTNFENRTVVDRAELLKAAKLATVFSRNEANIIKIQTLDSKLKISSEAKQLGSQETELEAQTAGEEISIAFNGKFLIDALSSCPTSQLSVEFSGNLSPALIKPIGEDGLEYVIMPIRLS